MGGSGLQRSGSATTHGAGSSRARRRSSSVRTGSPLPLPCVASSASAAASAEASAPASAAPDPSALPSSELSVASTVLAVSALQAASRRRRGRWRMRTPSKGGRNGAARGVCCQPRSALCRLGYIIPRRVSLVVALAREPGLRRRGADEHELHPPASLVLDLAARVADCVVAAPDAVAGLRDKLRASQPEAAPPSEWRQGSAKERFSPSLESLVQFA